MKDHSITPYLLRLQGSPREMGRAHGAAAKEAGALESVWFFGTFVDHVFRFSCIGPFDRWLRRCVRGWVGAFLERGWIERIPQYQKEMIEGFSEGSGVPVPILSHAFVMPDVHTYLLARRSWFLRAARLEQSPLGCTAFVTAGDRNRGMPFLHSRNLDFPGGAKWSDFPAVVEYNPDDGLRHVSVTSLGIDTAGVTSMNEAGLTLSLNMNYSHEVRPDSMPIVGIGHEVIRRARNLSEAVELLGQFGRGSGWSFLVSSAQEKNAVVVETDGAELRVRGLNRGFAVLTNHYSDEDLKAGEYWITPGREIDSRDRQARVIELLSGMFRDQGGITAEQAVAILGDSREPSSGKERAFGSTVSQVHTVTSAVFDSEKRRIYVACGEAPTASNRFAAIEVFPGPIRRDERVGAERIGEAPQVNAREDYVAAYEAYFPEEDLPRVALHLERAIQRMPSEGLYRSVLGLVNLKRKLFAEAQVQFESAILCESPSYRVDQARLFLARLFDLMGNREKARENYRGVADSPEFGRRARKGLRTPWTLKQTRRFVIDFTLGDAIES